MKIFELNMNGETEWVAADNIVHALKVYCDISSLSLDDFGQDDNIEEVPESKWEQLEVYSEDDEVPITFKEWMQTNVEPGIIASTAY